jgi:hypothetical protein
MHPISSRAATAIMALALAGLASQTADAACKKMGFLVNDYGKDGPTKDAQELLDKHIAKWAQDQGITKYTVGKKDVSCELFLNLIVVDEHTCTASATVCWDDKPTQPSGSAQSSKAAASGGTPAVAPAKEKQPSAPAAQQANPPVKGVVKTADPSASAPIETGTVPGANAAVDAGAAAVTGAPGTSDKDSAAAAAAAAERAAAAAERAAEAAERAAKAAVSAENSGVGEEEGIPKPAEKAPVVPPVAPATVPGP